VEDGAGPGHGEVGIRDSGFGIRDSGFGIRDSTGGYCWFKDMPDLGVQGKFTIGAIR
jgi:hypothetical protein